MSDFELQQFVNYVQECLKEACGLDELVVDDDGDWPIKVRDILVFVEVSAEPEPHVHLYTRIATGVSSEAWAEINHLNAVMTWAKIVWHSDGSVFVDQRLHHAAVNAVMLDRVLEAMADYSGDCGPLLEAVYSAAPTAAGLKRSTPTSITSLPDNGIFVFGSGVGARHSGGAARLAFERFGAERGVGEGLRGHSYALPTMSGFNAFAEAAARFLSYAGAHPDLDFWLTRVGCGHAGMDEATVAPVFAAAPLNVIKPKGW